MNKKFHSLALSCAMLFSLSACAEGSGSTNADTPTPAPSATAKSTNALVVYYSATGSTKKVAETIADTVEADIFEITPKKPYTSADLDWNDSNSRVVREHEDETLRKMELTETTAENWDKYDTVFIGYPIWWGIAAWPVNSFIASNDFTGKTVIPFCTSSSSGLGESGKNLAEQAGTGDWQDGQRFSSNADDAEVAQWAKTIVK
jgi:flavodoxin